MIVRAVADLWMKRFVRADHASARLAARLLRLLLLELPLLAVAAAAGYLLPPDSASTAVACAALFLALAAPIIKKEVGLPVQPLLSLPVRRTSLVHLVHAFTFLDLLNGTALVFCVAFWGRHIADAVEMPEALAWLLATLALLYSAHLAAMIVRRYLRLYTLATSAAVAAVALLSMLDILKGPGLIAAGADYVLGGIATGRTGRMLIPVLLLAAAAAAAYRATTASLRIDAQETGRAWKRRAAAPEHPVLALMVFQMRLLLRNARARFLAINVATFTLFGMVQLFLGLKEESPVFTIIGIAVLTSATGLGYAAHAFRVQSAFFDGLSAWPLSPSNLIRALVLLCHASTTVAFVLVLPVVLLARPDALAFYAAIFLYSIGIANPLFIFAGTFEKKRFDISLGAFSTRGAMVSHPFLNNAVLLAVVAPPLILLLTAGNPFGAAVTLPLALLGGAGVVMHAAWMRGIRHNLGRRRYLMLEGFRTG